MFIACDEAGHTGPNLLSKDQRYFSFASCCISDDEAYKIISDARKKYPTQMPELKSQKLLRSNQGTALIAEVFRKIDGRYAVNVSDKLLALCGWIFEYIYEPVLQGKNYEILARKNFHKYVAMFLWSWAKSGDQRCSTFVDQFQDYMRNLQTWRAPLLFENEQIDLKQNDPFNLILAFSNGYRHRIIPDNKNIQNHTTDGGKWLLDLSVSGLWSHMSHWSKNSGALNILCDESKPIFAFRDKIPTSKNDLKNLRESHYFSEDILGWELSRPIQFGNSRNHPSIQLADLVAGTAEQIFSGKIKPVGNLLSVFQSVERHGLNDHSILPNFEVLDLETIEGMANYRMMFWLANAAQENTWPLDNLEIIYRSAETL